MISNWVRHIFKAKLAHRAFPVRTEINDSLLDTNPTPAKVSIRFNKANFLPHFSPY